MSNSTLNRLQELAVQRFGEKARAVEPSADFFEALGIDSLQALDLLTDLEDAFDVEVPDYELQGVHTFQGLADVIEQRL